MRRIVTSAAAVLAAGATAIGTGAAASQAATSSSIRFGAGETQATVTGDLGHGGEAGYRFKAAAGQVAEVQFEGASTEYWTLVSPSGDPLHTGMTENQKDVTLRLPDSGSYSLDVQGANGGRYSLTLIIPVTIRFAPGTTSGSVSGSFTGTGSGIRNYVFSARAGQVATVDFARSARTESWLLISPSGEPLHTAMVENQRHVTVTLPQSGRYRLYVSSSVPGNYKLTLSIPAS